MQDKVNLAVIEDTGGLGYLIRTNKGEAVFGPLSLAATYSSPGAIQNALTRIKGEYDVRYRTVRMEVLPGPIQMGKVIDAT